MAGSAQAVAASTDARSLDESALAAVLARHLAIDAGPDVYLAEKSSLAASRTELLRSYMRVRPALQHATRVLDWGCRHAAMSRLLRADRGDAVDLHGCDVVPPDQYRAFHAAAALQYRRIDHPWRLAYDDGAFDAVIAAGTLEHVPNDGESMTQLWRVLAPGGVLVLTHLPNAWSWSEWMSRRWFPSQAHARRYRLARIRERLLSRGFVVEQAGYHQLMPSGLPASLLRHSPLRRLVDAIQPLNAFERVWPVRALSATMWLVARKHESF